MSQEAELKKIQEQVHVWFNRASLAYSQGNMDLSKMCLQRRFEWNKKSELLGIRADNLSIEPQEVFGEDFESGADETSSVPRKPYPFSGGLGQALELPIEDSNELDS